MYGEKEGTLYHFGNLLRYTIESRFECMDTSVSQGIPRFTTRHTNYSHSGQQTDSARLFPSATNFTNNRRDCGVVRLFYFFLSLSFLLFSNRSPFSKNELIFRETATRQTSVLPRSPRFLFFIRGFSVKIREPKSNACTHARLKRENSNLDGTARGILFIRMPLVVYLHSLSFSLFLSRATTTDSLWPTFVPESNFFRDTNLANVPSKMYGP